MQRKDEEAKANVLNARLESTIQLRKPGRSLVINADGSPFDPPGTREESPPRGLFGRPGVTVESRALDVAGPL
ncbi:hypothetical protein EYF80_037982 [Liparis tanakae]|uniref:Uncharacterized protein n=1 Tax=Liparis tanakae TaxID=230148 RepID=A0A4Z2GGE9_9TELE|nr:hypothetical protein EYF80_037982 [Liparis tanakae]